LTKFAVNTNNGAPSFYLDLRGKISQKFKEVSPSVTITDSGVPGLDGSFWVAKKGTDFVMVSTTGSYSIYFTNAASAPSCSASREASPVTKSIALQMVPNPATASVTIQGLEGKAAKVNIVDFQGKIVSSQKLDSNNTTLNITSLKSGIYMVNVESVDATKTMLLNVLSE
jgi:endoglucanase